MPTEADVQRAVDALSPVGKLVHLATRLDSFDTESMVGLMNKRIRASFEDELTRLARSVGCRERKGLVRSEDGVRGLHDIARLHGESIVRTYNFELAKAIEAIRTELPRANRATYTKRVIEWEEARSKWKGPQIGLMTEQVATQNAREAFWLFNSIEGEAVFSGPNPAAEPECQELLDGNPWPLEKMLDTPTPIHFNCSHYWKVEKGRVRDGDCDDLWVG